MNDEMKRRLEKHFALLKVQADLVMITFEKEIDRLHKSTQRATLILHIIFIGYIGLAISGWLALQFPHQFLNFWTLLAAKLAILWCFTFTLAKLLENWKIGRESNRRWKEDMKNRDERWRQLEEEELIKRKVELKTEKLVN